MTNREEVAKKLREVSTARTTDEVYVALLNCIGITYDYANLFNRLADLIDPTCHIVEVTSDGETSYTCSSCGNFGSKEVQLLDSFNFCPACGARVVRDDV